MSRLPRTVWTLAVGIGLLGGVVLLAASDHGALLELAPLDPAGAARPTLTSPFDVELLLDDGTAEGAVGLAGATARQFLWFSRFDPEPEPFLLEEIWVLFPPGPNIAVGGAVELAVYRDPDGDPANGAVLLSSLDVSIQAVDGATFSVYELDPAVEVAGPGDVLIGVVDRFVVSGVTSPTLPAALDQTATRNRSWIGIWSGDPPDPPVLDPPPDVEIRVIEDLAISGNWMIRGFGTTAPVIPVPTSGAAGLGALAVLLALAGVWLVGRRGAAALLLALLVLPIPALEAEVVIDDFQDPDPADFIEDPDVFNTDFVDEIVGTILGGVRGMEIARLSGTGTVRSDYGGGAPGTLLLTVPDGNRGQLLMSWIGDPDPFLGAPLEDVDLTEGGLNQALRVTIDGLTGTVDVSVEVASNGDRSQAGTIVTAPGMLLFPFSGAGGVFVASAGSGADFTAVDEVLLTLRATGSGGSPAAVTVSDFRATATQAPALTATMDDLDTAGTPIGATQVTPGTTVRYRVTITNTGGAAEQIDLSDIVAGGGEPGLLGTPGTLDSQPVAFDDTYTVPGNLSRSVDVLSGLLSNDADPDGGGVSVDEGSSDTVTARGGTVAYSGLGDGAFTYTPPTFFRGVDTFDYLSVDSSGNTAGATATLLVENLVWFVDDGPGGCAPPPCGTGTLADPFGDFSQLNAGVESSEVDVDQPGDILYVRTGSGSTDTGDFFGLLLESRQQLLGEGVPLVLNGQTFVPAGVRPVLTNTAGIDGEGIELGRDNTIRGLDLGDVPAESTRLFCFGFGTLTISDVAATSTGGVIDVAFGTLDVTFDSISSTASEFFPAISLVGVGGSFAVSNPGAGVDTSIAGADAGIYIDGALPGATFSFGETSVIATAPTLSAEGVLLLFNDPFSSVTFDSLDVTSLDGPALVAVANGLLNIGGPSNTLNAAGGEALHLELTDVGPGLTFDSLTSVSSGDDGIDLEDVTGTGPTQVTVTGLTAVVGPGSSCFESTGAGSFTFAAVDCVGAGDDGFELNDPTGTLSFGATTIGVAGDEGIDLDGGTGSVTFTGTLDVFGTQPGAGPNINEAIFIGDFDGSFEVVGTTTLNGNEDLDLEIFGGSGSVTFAGLDIDNRSGNGILIDGTGGPIQFGATTIDNQAVSVIEAVMITGTTGGSVSFASLVIDNTGSTATGVDLLGNTATVAINNATIDVGAGDGISSDSSLLDVTGLAITSTTGTGFRALNGGSVTVASSANTIDKTGGGGGTALTIDGTPIGAAGVTFASISAAAGSTNGIFLDNTGTNPFQVTGDGGSAPNGSGGTITGTTSRPVDLTVGDQGLNATLRQMNLTTASDSGVFLGDSGAGTVELVLDANVIDDIPNDEAISVLRGFDGDSTISIDNNLIGQSSGNIGGPSPAVALLLFGSSTTILNLTGNQIRKTSTGIEERVALITNVDPSGTMEAVVTGNTFRDDTLLSAPLRQLDVQNQGDMCMTLSGNDAVNGGGASGSGGYRLVNSLSFDLAPLNAATGANLGTFSVAGVINSVASCP